ncbi:MAG TPA: hypothetical protein VGX16_03960, partial [Solirubrobacteraceae bacterium]|nr:hypothetical protein [Solirubrobacteraceae bacterium]
DLFVAGVFGGMLAATGDRRGQLRGAALVAVLALAFDFLFFVVNELPATVPVALAVLLRMLVSQTRKAPSRWSSSPSTTSVPP